MLIGTFINICKDFTMSLLSVVSTFINTLFAMPVFWDGTTYVISVGHIVVALISFSVIFGFIYGVISEKIGGMH